MCQGRLILGNKLTILESDVDHGGGCACVGVEGVQKISVYPSQFAVNLKFL